MAETLDWTQALLTLRQDSLEPEVVTQTLGCLLKDRHDLETLTALGGRLARRARAGGVAA